MTTLHERLVAATSPLTVAEERTPEELAAVVRAVVELHAPVRHLVTGDIVGCRCNIDHQPDWPCEDIRTIAETLGVPLDEGTDRG